MDNLKGLLCRNEKHSEQITMIAYLKERTINTAFLLALVSFLDSAHSLIYDWEKFYSKNRTNYPSTNKDR